MLAALRAGNTYPYVDTDADRNGNPDTDTRADINPDTDTRADINPDTDTRADINPGTYARADINPDTYAECTGHLRDTIRPQVQTGLRGGHTRRHIPRSLMVRDAARRTDLCDRGPGTTALRPADGSGAL